MTLAELQKRRDELIALSAPEERAHKSYEEGQALARTLMDQPENRELHLEAVKDVHYLFKDFPQAMKNDPEIAYEAIIRAPTHVAFMGEDLKLAHSKTPETPILSFLGDPLGKTLHCDRNELASVKEQIQKAEHYVQALDFKFQKKFSVRDPVTGESYERFLRKNGTGEAHDHPGILQSYANARIQYDKSYQTMCDDVDRFNSRPLQQFVRMSSHIRELLLSDRDTPARQESNGALVKDKPVYIEYSPTLPEVMKAHGMTRASMGSLEKISGDLRGEIETTLRYTELKQLLGGTTRASDRDRERGGRTKV